MERVPQGGFSGVTKSPVTATGCDGGGNPSFRANGLGFIMSSHGGSWARMTAVTWKTWNPGLDNDDLTLGEVYGTLPGNDPEAINFVVRLFENPKSPIAFKGAITLERHDCVHVLLGRGLLPQDEAFVIGFTMGTSKEITSFESSLFQVITKHLYPHPYKFSDQHLIAYQLGLQKGKVARCKLPIYDYPLEEKMDMKLSELREMFDICSQDLKKIYACERLLIPEGKVSERLPN